LMSLMLIMLVALSATPNAAASDTATANTATAMKVCIFLRLSRMAACRPTSMGLAPLSWRLAIGFMKMLMPGGTHDFQSGSGRATCAHTFVACFMVRCLVGRAAGLRTGPIIIDYCVAFGMMYDTGRPSCWPFRCAPRPKLSFRIAPTTFAAGGWPVAQACRGMAVTGSPLQRCNVGATTRCHACMPPPPAPAHSRPLHAAVSQR
jgi:hypothetical protein